MAMTKDEHEALLRRIAETGGATPEMLDDIQKLRDEYDEREGMLRRYGEERDKNPPDGERSQEDKDEEGERRSDKKEVDRDDIDWKGEYEKIRKQYVERFFSSPEKAKDEQDEDVTKDGESMTYEELFKERVE